MTHEQRSATTKCISRRGSDGAILAHWSRRENMGPWSGLISVHWANQQFRLSGSWNMCCVFDHCLIWTRCGRRPDTDDYCICARPFSQKKKIKSREEKNRAEHKFDKFIFHYSSRFFLFDSSCWLDGAKSSATRCGCGDARASELAKSLENSNLIPKARIKILGMFSTINHQLKIFFALPQSLWNNHLNLNKIIKISKKREEKKRICMNLI